MADFNKYYDRLLKPSEGGYVNHPNDKGGETYGGIARNSNPNWEGWVFIDAKKKIKPIPRYTIYKELSSSVKSYFKKMYWDKLQADKIENQSVAELLVDFLVNGGFVISRVQKYLGIKADGIIGKNTITAINKANQSALYKFVSEWRYNHFDNIVKNDPTQEVFYKGWMDRLSKFTFTEAAAAGGGLVAILLIGLGMWAFNK